MSDPAEMLVSLPANDPSAGVGHISDARPRGDPLRRLVPTSHCAALSLMGRNIALQTNSSKVLRHLVRLFAGPETPPNGSAEFLWKIVVESDRPFCQPWPRRSVFSGGGLRFAQFGQKNFLVVDIQCREAIAFVSEELVDDEAGFTSPFLDTLFYMVSGSLGLLPLASACVADGKKGLLVVGAANQGKTTASYLAAKDGLTFHADQSVFLELNAGELRAWADFVPAAFRPDALQFLPELKTCTRPFSYCDFQFLYMSGTGRSSDRREFINPVCFVILERESSSVPRLVRIGKEDFRRSLPEHIAFKEDERFEQQQRSILQELAELPAYRLAYGSDPAIAAPFFRQLLERHGELACALNGT